MKCNLIIFKSYRLHFGLGDEGKEDVVKNEARFSLTKHCGFLVTPTLLEHSADVNSRDTNGWTPLHYASRGWHEGCAGVVRLLLDRGADVGARNLSGKTASNVADGTEREQILQLLSQHAERMNERGRGFYG